MPPTQGNVLRKLRIPFTLGYVAFILFVHWNFFTFYLACLGAWLIILLWLPFNPKPYKTSLSFKLLLFFVQALIVFMFAGSVWKVFPVSRLLNPKTTKQPAPDTMPLSDAKPAPQAAARTEENILSQHPWPPEDRLNRGKEDNASRESFAEEAEPAGSLPPSHIFLKNSDKKTHQITPEQAAKKETNAKGQQKNAKEAPIQAPNTTIDPIMLRPGYDQALNEVMAEISRQDKTEVYPLLSDSQRQLITHTVPFVRPILMKSFLKKNQQQWQAQIQTAKENNLSAEELQSLREKLAKANTAYQRLETRYSEKYQRSRIEEKLNKAATDAD